MADVSVEFGAKDVGLEKTLKGIQDEISRLEGSVKSGNLPLEDLKGKMKEIGQLTSMEKRIQAMGEQSDQSAPKVDALGKDIKGAGDKSEKMGDQAGIGFGKLAAAVGVGQIAAKAFTAVLDSAFSAVRNTIQGFTDALDLGGRLSDLSASTGETAGNLLLLERAFDTSGAGAEKVGPAIAKMQKSIQDASEGSLEAVQSLGLMGLTAADLEGKLPNEQLKVLASGITSIDDPTQRAAAAMGIFGRSGADLIPLLTNLDAEMSDATATVGSMADIMNRRNSVFDAVADRFKIIQEKVRDFAAGILDKAIPAIDAITTALSRIDAAAIGQKLADAFLGGQDAMKGFQAAVDAIKIGKVSLAFQAFWESTKLQAMQTANSIVDHFSAAFATISDIMSVIFRSDGPAWATLTSAIDYVSGYLTKQLSGSLANMLSGLGPAFSGIRDSLQQSADAGATAAELALQRIPVTAGLAADEIGNELASATELFALHLGDANTEFFNTADQAAKVAALQDEITAAVADTNAERAAGTADTEAELARRTEIRAAAEAAAAADKAARTELITLETQLNAAKAAGNEELATTLEKQLEQKKAKEEIKKLTEEYVKTLGLDADEAARLATNFVNAKNAAASIGDRAVSVSITTKVDDTRWKDLLADLAANADPKAVQVALAVTGQDNLKDAYATLQDMETVQKNFTAAFETIGAQSLEEVKANLEGIPTEAQRQLALQLTGEEDFDRAVRKLDSVPLNKNTRLLLESQGFDNVDELQNALKGIPDQKRTEVLLDALGLDTVDEAKTALDRILANDGKKAAIAVAADTTEAESSIEALGGDTQTVPITADTTEAQAKLRELAEPLTVRVQFDTSQVAQEIAQMQLDIQNSFIGGQGGAGGTGGQGGQGGAGGNATANIGTLQSIVSEIKGFVQTLTNQLPTPALA